MHSYPSSEVPTCLHCGLVQFRTVKGLCRRCGRPLDPHAGRAPVCPAVHVGFSPSAEKLAERIGTTIRSLRKERRLTQQCLADRAGTARTYISRLECGLLVPSLDTLERVVMALNLTDLADLFLRLRRQDLSP